MNSEINGNRGVNVKLWRSIATISGLFALLICFLIIANYIQMNRLDPVNTEAVNLLVQRLSENPNDEALRNEIRALDLLVRKAYFTNQWQVRTGGYILLISLAVMIISLQILKAAKPVEPDIPNASSELDQLWKKLSRKWISIGGIAILVIALVLAFLTHDKLSETFKEAAIAASADPVEEEETVNQMKTNIKSAGALASEEEIEETKNEEAVEIPAKADEYKENSSTESEQIKAEPKTASVSAFTSNARKNYPAFRGAGGLGIAYQKNIPVDWDGPTGKNVIWKIKTDHKGYNSPIIWGDRLFVTGADEESRYVYCYDKNTGELKWKKAVTNIPGSPANAPDVTEDTGLAAPTATTDGINVYAIFANGDIIAIDMNGTQVWARNLGLPQNHYGHSSSLQVYEDKVIIEYDQGRSPKVMALSTKTGEEVWSTPRQVKISWASPVIAERKNHTEVILIADPSVAGYDVHTGKELWKLDCIYGEVGPSVAYSNEIVFAINEYASLVAIGGGNQPEVIWEDYDYLSDVPSPVAIDDMLFVATSYGVVVCHNAKTGEKYWEHEFDNGFYASPIIAEGKVYLIDRDGIMQIFKADKTFQLIGEAALGEGAVASPAFADGKIFIRGEENLYCIGNGN